MMARCCMSKERKKNHLEVDVSTREGEGHSEEEGSRLGMLAMVVAEGRRFWHWSI